MSVSVQAIPQEPSATALKTMNEFYVPNILTFNLKKTTEDRLQAAGTDDSSSRQNGEIVAEEDEELKMSPSRRGNTINNSQTSSFLLQPFLKPVDQTIESNKENPVLKALFGGQSPPGLSQWKCVTRNTINNCHPFKRTELSHDLNSDDTPIQVPQSLVKPVPKPKSPEKAEKTFEPKAPALKNMRSDFSVKVESELSIKKSNSLRLRSPSREKIEKNGDKEKDLPELSIFSRRRKVSSQTTFSVPRPRTQYVNTDRLIQLRTIVDSAIKNHKVYSMTGCYNSVRNALKQRGWIEKIDNDVKGRRKINRYEEIGLCQGEAEIINKMLRNVTEDLCWLSRPYPYYCWKDFDRFEMVNRLPRAYFSNKVGLCNSLQHIQWYYEAGVCTTKFPRTYNTSTRDEMDAFKDDFRLTACIGTLKWFLHAYKTGGEKAVRSHDGKVDMNVIEFALRRCAEFVKTKQHEDIDIADIPTVWEYQWEQFLSQYYKIMNEGQILKDDRDGITIKALISNVQSMINILKPYWPQFDIEGYQNFWIVKPGGRCCGAGIVIRNNLEQILIMINPHSMKETRFIVQKYIERPLLIYNTKFDIRQWFLVTNVYPLTIWMYKESYLRFCSQPFTLKNTHESIHLCNNAVQRKYKNGKRDRGLPDENMWDCYTFQTYLKAIGHPDAWEKYIYPGMKEGFIGALLASQDSMERKKNCFELYGADFMISDTLTDGPWLIEINSNPAMDSSTSVTARLCPQVLEDIVKVVIDRRDNKSAPTGSFEMVFKQNCPPVPPYLGMSLCVKGNKAFKSSGDHRTLSRKSKNKKSSESVNCIDTEEESTAEEITSADQTPKNADAPQNAALPASNKKTLHSESGKEIGNKRRKTDWVRKNIEDVKSLHTIKTSKTPEPEKDASDEVYKEKMVKLLGTMEKGQIVEAILNLRSEEEKQKKAPIKAEDLIFGGIEVSKKKLDAPLEDVLGKCEISEMLSELMDFVRQKSSEDRLLSKECVDVCGLISRLTTKSCPEFDAAFENELHVLDEHEKQTKKLGPVENSEPSISRVARTDSETSLEYFRNWKSKLYETRKTCEDLLTQLQAFKETNSKVKFQEAVEKRLKEEVDFVKRIKQRRKCKERGKAKAGGKEFFEGKEKFWEGDAPLAINSENGAVRNYNLPKIKQRSRPLLPNGASDHGRKIDVALEQTCCH